MPVMSCCCNVPCVGNCNGTPSQIILDFTHFDVSCVGSGGFPACSPSANDIVVAQYYGANNFGNGATLCYASDYPTHFDATDCTCIKGYRIGWFLNAASTVNCWAITIGSSFCPAQAIPNGMTISKDTKNADNSIFGRYTVTGATDFTQVFGGFGGGSVTYFNSCLNGQYIDVLSCARCTGIPGSLTLSGMGTSNYAWSPNSGLSLYPSGCSPSVNSITETFAIFLNRPCPDSCTYTQGLNPVCVGGAYCAVQVYQPYGTSYWQIEIVTVLDPVNGYAIHLYYRKTMSSLSDIVGTYTYNSQSGQGTVSGYPSTLVISP